MQKRGYIAPRDQHRSTSVVEQQLAVNSISTIRADLEESLAAYSAAGFANVELALSHVRSFMAGGRTPKDVRDLLDRNNLRCIGGFEGVVECYSDPDSRRGNLEKLAANAALLADLGANILVVGTDGPENGRSVDDPIGPIVHGFREASDVVRDTGITLCLEFNWSPIVKSLRTAADIARRADRENIGVLFDPAHYHCTPTKFDQLSAENIAMIRHVHVDDMQDKPGELSDCNADRVLPGQGCLDLRALFGRLQDHGYRGHYSIEMFAEELWSMPAREAAALLYESLRYLLD
jgi:4-hydroxyphenylpyruvate dioxygenase